MILKRKISENQKQNENRKKVQNFREKGIFMQLKIKLL